MTTSPDEPQRPTPEKLTDAEREVLRERFYAMLARVMEAKEPTPEPRSPRDDGEGVTPLRLAKAEPDEVETYNAADSVHWQAIRMLDGHILGWLVHHRHIDEDQETAGQMFYSDWYRAGLAASGVIDPGRVIVDGGRIENVSDLQIFYSRRWAGAVQVLGKLHSTALIDMLLFEVPLAEYGIRQGYSRNPKLAAISARTTLVNGLQILVPHYLGGKRERRTHASHASGYRPKIMSSAG